MISSSPRHFKNECFILIVPIPAQVQSYNSSCTLPQAWHLMLWLVWAKLISNYSPQLIFHQKLVCRLGHLRSQIDAPTFLGKFHHQTWFFMWKNSLLLFEMLPVCLFLLLYQYKKLFHLFPNSSNHLVNDSLGKHQVKHFYW